ncbi:zinc ribbon domain-containing protein [Konateibacter massiliensis]|uniref:zinc ribbon domain-containing protein n=1 Tax=Konateibacter massiliensis TaxID=2002841 RepID=UPI001179E6DB|nr:zinc ribbon domain-containing protein [Konateibacter massiliensis]
MALIKCPECGKEISDKATSCPSCGCPIDNTIIESTTETPIKENGVDSVVQTVKETQPKKVKGIKVIIPIIAAVVVIAIIGGVIYNLKVIKPKKTYTEAVSLLESGKYDEANQLFTSISGYEDVATLQEELKYESRVYQCIKSIKERLKNPDSLQIYEVVFFSKEYRDDIKANDKMKEALNEFISNYGDEPVCLMRYGAQNGFGGNTTSYGFFTYQSKDDAYVYLGSCDTLDEDKVDDDEETICLIINMIRDNFKEEGTVDIDRIKTILKDDNYTSIKIIN